jgi:hypothetical protein
MTPTGLRRKDVEAAGRKVVRLNGKQILLLSMGGASSPSPIAAPMKAIP